MAEASPLQVIESDESTPWGSVIEIERRRRIFLSLWAYAYEYMNSPIVDDATFDLECYLVDPTQETEHPALDKFFREEFHPDTGMWIRSHPELDRVHNLGRRLGYWE